MAGPATHPDKLFGDLAGTYAAREPLGPRTWIGAGGAADLFFIPDDIASLQLLLERACERNLPVRALGGGANLLVCDEGVDGIVISLEGDAFRAARLDRNSGVAQLGAGADLPRLVMETAMQGLGGLDALAGVPGTIGGATRMNAGGKYGEIGDLVTAVEIVLPDGTVQNLRRDNIRFDYRSCTIPQGVITQIELQLRHEDPGEVHDRVKQIMAEKKRAQPLAERSAGCVFKNPLVEGERISAGKLIDEAGLKGTRVGGAAVSERHANFLVTQPNCTARDILQLIERVREAVASAHDVVLETELVIWSRRDAGKGASA